MHHHVYIALARLEEPRLPDPLQRQIQHFVSTMMTMLLEAHLGVTSFVLARFISSFVLAREYENLLNT